MKALHANIIRRLEGARREAFINTLRRSDRDRVRALGEAWAGGNPPKNTPKWVTVQHADGTTETYVLSAKATRGKYGRFRRALRSDGKVVGVKDFRLPGRFLRDFLRRNKRIDALVQEGVIRPETARHLNLNEEKLVQLVRTRRLDLLDVAAVAKDRTVVIAWVTEGKLTAEEGTELLFDRAFFAQVRSDANLSPDVADKIATTHYRNIEAIDTEYDLLRLVQSPLAETGRFSISERLFVMNRAMDMDALDLAKLPMDAAARAGVTRHMALRLAYGLARYHQAGVVHRDVKLENVLLDISGAVELADPGLATHMSAEGLATGAVGTLQYAAPEMVAYELDLNLPGCPRGRLYTQAVDVFSLGVALATLAVRRNLIQGEGTQALASLHELVHLRETCPKYAETGLCDLGALLSAGTIAEHSSPTAEHLRSALTQWHTLDPDTAGYVFTRMLVPSPDKRASMQDVCSHFAANTRRAEGDARITAELVKTHAEGELRDECATMVAFKAAVTQAA